MAGFSSGSPPGGPNVRHHPASFARLAAFFVAAELVAGCASTHGIAPESQRLGNDQLATDAAIQSAELDAKWPDQEWWRTYGDPQLNGWVRAAIAGNPGLAEATARVRAAMARAGVAEAAEAPQIGVDIEIQRHQFPSDFFYGPGELAKTKRWNNNAMLGLSYALDFWGREKNRTEYYLDIARTTAAEARVARLELEGNVVRAYVQFSLLHAELDVARAILNQQQHILDIAKRRLKGGIGTQFEVSQADMPQPETRRRIDLLQEQLALSRNQLAALAGKGPGAAAELVRPTLVLADQPRLPATLPLELVGHRPDIVASRWRVAAQARGIDTAHADFYPNIDIIANFGYSAVEGAGMLSFLTGQKSNYGVGFALSLPIFDGGRRRAQLGEATAGYDAAVAAYNQTLVRALKNISDELIRMRSVKAQQVLAAESMAVAQKTYNLSLRAFRGGLTDYLHVLNAQTHLFEHQLTEQRIRATLLAIHADLVLALGGGAVSDKDSPYDQEMQPASIATDQVGTH